MSLKTMDLFHAIPSPSNDSNTPQTPQTPQTPHTLQTPISPPPTSPPHSPLPRLPPLPRPKPPRPVRKSSEGPEVVQEYLDHKQNGGAFVFDGERFKRQRVGNGTLSQKQIDPDQVETKRWPSPVVPNERRSFVPFLNQGEREEDGWRKERRKTGICWMVVVGLVAFLVGGGIGGGIGGALVAREKAKSTVATETPALTPTATTTLATSSPTATMILDQAGCPLIINKNYTTPSTSKTYRQFCGSDTVSSNPGTTISMGNATASTLNECLDKCSSMNGCMAATWVIFSATNPGSNSVCFFKSEVGVVTTVSDRALAMGVLL
ncbi:hypothetical protein BGZ60DRAFT_559913 [Tricladium varicosporioides]|nr:hypothetical protein BGZ60DRAFT_559913 [Hymenoscyphus varicosporioides]